MAQSSALEPLLTSRKMKLALASLDAVTPMLGSDDSDALILFVVRQMVWKVLIVALTYAQTFLRCGH